MQLCQEESTVCCECFFISWLPRFLRCLVRDLNRQATWFACAASVCFIQVQSIGNCKAIVIGFWFESSCPAIEPLPGVYSAISAYVIVVSCVFWVHDSESDVFGAWLPWQHEVNRVTQGMLTWRWLGVSHGRPREMYSLGSFVDWLRTQSSFGM